MCDNPGSTSNIKRSMTFTFQSKTLLADKDTEALVFIHPSGMRHIHIPSDFPELCLVISVPTPTDDSTGMAHILEHMVMSGSKKYPQEGPFFSMHGKTVAHEMNASTDRAVTSYHFATTDRKDYENLSKLYLDLVLHPLLRQEDFNREAWRLEVDDQGNHRLNGVVLNEMLGAYSNPNRHRYEALVAIIGRGTASEFLTGGHPLSIPAVDYETLRSFYSSRYYYGNMVFVTTGDIDPAVIHSWIEESVETLPQNPTEHVLRNGERQGVGANPHEILELEPFGMVSGREILALGIPELEGQPQKAMWAWKSDYVPGSIHELRDQLIIEALFSDANPAFVELKRNVKRPVSGSLLFHPTARMGGKIGFVMEMNAQGPEELEFLNSQVDWFLSRSLNAGLSASGWEHSLASLIGSQRKRTPLHDAAISIGGLAIENLPLDADMNNRQAAIQLKAEGAPTPDMLRAWMSRWEPQAILLSYPKPELLEQWRDKLIQMAANKVAQGVVPTNRIHPEGAASVDLLPRVRTQDLSPVFDKMAKIYDIPAQPANNYQDPDPDVLAEAYLVHGHVADSNEIDGSFGRVLWPRHLHVVSSLDERAMSVSLDFQVEDLPLDRRVALSAVPLLRRRLGWNGQDFETSAAEARDKGIACELFLSSNDGAAEATHWLLGVKATPTDMDEPNEHLAFGVRSLLNLNFDNLQDLAQAAVESRKTIEGKIEELTRKRERTKSLAAVDATAARHLSCSVDPQLVLDFISQVEADPSWGRDQLKGAMAQLNLASRRVMTVGNEQVLQQGRLLARDMMSVAPAWRGGKEQPWAPEDMTHTTAHVFRPGGSHDVERHIEAVNLRDHTRMRLAAQVASNLLTPYLHENLREMGGAYGSAMTVKHHSIVLGSYNDPSPDAAHQVFNAVSEVLERMANERDEDLLEEARVAVAAEIVSPGDGRMGLRDALNNLSLNLGRDPDYRAKDLAELARVGWQDVLAVSGWLRPGNRKAVDLTVGPTAPQLIAGKKSKLAR